MADAPTGICVEVLTVLGSAPRETGAQMLVRSENTEGSIGGGQLEYAAITRARALLNDWRHGPDEVTETHALGPHLGQCCGGVVTLGYKPWFAASLPPPPPLFHLQLHGAGHVGRALVRSLSAIPCTIDWIDTRAEEFPTVVPGTSARVRRRVIDRPETAVLTASRGSFFLVMTHSHALDATITAAALMRGDAAYVGLIGSATKRARFEHRWRRQGFDDRAIARLTCPIGIPGIEGKQPEILALAVAAQLLRHATAAPAQTKATDALSLDCTGCAAATRCLAHQQ